LVERRANAFVEPEREWTLAETLYALVLFGASCFGIYAFFGWYFSPPS
jgi:multisubunit Na+/H+ antiporter MnhB subunit